MRRALGPAEAGPGQTITTGEASDLQVVVPDARLLFPAAFSQTGDDVPLTGENGGILPIRDYFVLDAPPTLLCADRMTVQLSHPSVSELRVGQFFQ